MRCPVCCHEVDYYEICEHCQYQNSGPNEDLDGPTGPNVMTLREARRAYRRGEEIY